jgi:hypothetical protein
VDAEFTELDVQTEVQSPTEKSAAKSKGFLSLVSNRNGRKLTPPVQDPTFKDFTYFCEDPDALVEVTNLVSELRPPPPPPSEDDSEDFDEDAASAPLPTEYTGTPLASFVDNGHLNVTPMSPKSFHEDLKKLEATMAEQFERVEFTISRERPPRLQQQQASSSSDEVDENSAERVHVEKYIISPSAAPQTPAAAVPTSSDSSASRSQHSRGKSSASSSADDGPLTMD